MPGTLPAPVRLQRLYIGLLAVTVLVSLISLTSLLRVKQSLAGLSETGERGPAMIEEMKTEITSMVVAIHRSVANPSSAGNAQTGDPAYRWEKGGRSGLSGNTLESFGRELARLRQMALLAQLYRDLRKWEDLQIVLRDADRTSQRVIGLLDSEAERIRRAGIREGRRLQNLLVVLGGLFLLTLVASLGIAAGLHRTWKQFERSVLGI